MQGINAVQSLKTIFHKICTSILSIHSFKNCNPFPHKIHLYLVTYKPWSNISEFNMKAEELGNCHETSFTKVISQRQYPINTCFWFLPPQEAYGSQNLLGQYIYHVRNSIRDPTTSCSIQVGHKAYHVKSLINNYNMAVTQLLLFMRNFVSSCSYAWYITRRVQIYSHKNAKKNHKIKGC
jgi:hypothetical protein